MNKPDAEITMMILEKKTSQRGKEYFTGRLGFNRIYADEYNGKLYVKIQSWPKEDRNQDSPGFISGNEEDVPF